MNLRRNWPWRSARCGWAVAAAVLIAGVPLFLCMPPWVDVTMYDVAARTVLRGGVHYRDVFDTNLPGVVWVMAAIRATCGPSYEVLRAWDLLAVGLIVLLLYRWASRCVASSVAGAWFAAAVALFYPFTSEFNHCQRDPWMLLPATVAASLRLASLNRAVFSFRWSVLEGFVWGVAVWLKPHVVIPAAAVWLTSVILVKRPIGSGWHRLPAGATCPAPAGCRCHPIGRDLLGLVCGGLLAGIPGIAWLVGTGAWPDFWDVFTRWNPEYMREGVWDQIPHKATYIFWCFQPWGLVHLAAIPLAIFSLWEALVRPKAELHARALLAALYLGWLAQAVVLQKGLEYVQVPQLILALALLASRGWSVGFAYLVWFALIAGVLALAGAVPGLSTAIAQFNGANRAVRIEQHPLADPDIIGLWPRCWREGGTPQVRDRLGQYTNIFCATNWEDLDGVAGFLRTVEPPIRDRELTGWHDTTHPLYLMLDLEPSTRYMHYGTVFPLRGKLAEIRDAVAASPQRYVVSDLRRMTYSLPEAYAPGEAGPNSLPAWFPKSQRNAFPWNQPIVFRSGRYIVHKIVRPPDASEIDIPDWYHLDDLGPGK